MGEEAGVGAALRLSRQAGAGGRFPHANTARQTELRRKWGGPGGSPALRAAGVTTLRARGPAGRKKPMRAETERLVEDIEKSLALLRQRLGYDTAAHRLEELNAMSENPTLWNDPARAQALMRDRQRLRMRWTPIRGWRASFGPAGVDRARRSRGRRGGGGRRRGGDPQLCATRRRSARSRRCSTARRTATTPSSRSTPARAAPRAATGRRCWRGCTCAGPRRTA